MVHLGRVGPRLLAQRCDPVRTDDHEEGGLRGPRRGQWRDPAWGDALLFARGSLQLTADELLRFWNDYMALYLRYADATDPPTDGAGACWCRS
ncbi:hypothetical protein GCM10009609_56760 [Pseudonocardia aurantiaca]